MRHLLICLTLLIPLARFCVVARADERPNILFCISDDQSYPYTGAYGTKWVSTPGFDRVAREGLLFNNAYTPNAKCAPSRACILTGRNSWQLEEAANHWCYFPEKFKVYTEALSDAGYFVGSTGKGWAPGKVVGNRGPLAGKPYQKQHAKPPTSGISSIDYASNFNDFLDDRPTDKPFCFWYGATEPHRGYEFQSGIKKGGKSIDQIEKVPDFWPDNETVRTDMLDYAFEIEHFDHHLVRMLDELDKRGLLDNTLIVVTADNGMPFPRVKGQEYEMSNHLPLAIMWKKGITKPGRTIDDYVSFIDYAPTFIEVAGLKWSQTGMQLSPGRSLVEIFDSEKSGHVIPERDHVLIGKERHDVGRPEDQGYPIRGIVKDGYIFLRNFEPDRWPGGNPETGYLNCDGSPTKTEVLKARRDASTHHFWQESFGKRKDVEMFHASADRYCLTNVADSPDAAARRAALEQQMTTELKQQGDPRMEGKGYLFDRYPYADKSGLGFYERYMKGEKMRAGWVNPSDFEKIDE
ncbi:MAG: sulfatase-like hydrolase/transferase [Phycisphaera sp.]|nr:sulfatase-like hydrolase/transferase [Phycisphaera sp.]